MHESVSNWSGQQKGNDTTYSPFIFVLFCVSCYAYLPTYFILSLCNISVTFMHPCPEFGSCRPTDQKIWVSSRVCAFLYPLSGMSAQNATTPPSAPIEPKRLSGFRTALQYTGIPASWLDKRPKLPSRNWLIFLSVTSSITGYYIYDRRQCKRIRKHYVDLVKDQAEELVGALDWPRRVTVYGSKWPGDEDYDQGIKYFRKYVKVGALAPLALIT